MEEVKQNPNPKNDYFAKWQEAERKVAKHGELKNIKLAISSTHWDSNKMMIFDWKFCTVCGDELPKDAR